MTPRSLTWIAGLALVIAPTIGGAQQAKTPTLDFSGVIYGNYSFATDSARKAAAGGSHPNAFTIERVYLNFRMPVGDNASIRATTDVFQNTNSSTNGYYTGWTIRLKYAYLEYLMAKDALGPGSNVKVRLGMIQNAYIDYEEGFWPRWLGTTITDRLSYFPSSDAGVGGLVTLPKQMGELYGEVVNGSGYSAYETNTFKDVALRAAFTPFGNQSGFINTFAITPWVYLGENGSKFSGVTDGLTKDRYGLFVGIKEPRLTAGLDLNQRKDESETGTSAANRGVVDTTGRALGVFAVVRPGAWASDKAKSTWGLVGRLDHFTPNTSPTATAYAGDTPSYNYSVLGIFWEPTPKTSLSLDWQQQTPTGFPEPFPSALKVTPTQSTIFVHWQANF